MRVDTSTLDNDIRKVEEELASRFPPETLDSIRQTYRAHIDNAEHDASQRIQQQCQCEWLPGLVCTL